MSDGQGATGKRRTWKGVLLLLAVLLLASAVPGHAWHGTGGFRGTDHRFRDARVFIEPSIVVPFGPSWAPFWAPYAYPYAYPPTVVQPPPQVYLQPPPSRPSWYYCDNPPGYYPYVQQCPGGWRPVAPTPP